MSTNSNQNQWKIGDDENLHRKIDLVAGLLIAFLNIVEITLIANIRRKKRIYEIILISLSVSDCMYGFSNVTISSIYIFNSNKYGDLLETAYLVHAFFVLTSIFHLIFIAVDRVMIVLRPFQYESIFTTKRLKIGIAVLWIIAFIIGIITYTAYELNEMEPTDTNTLNQSISPYNTSASFTRQTSTVNRAEFHDDMQLVLSIIIVIMDFLMVICYSIIIYHMGYKTRKNVVPKNVEDERLPIICVFIAAVFVIFTLPYAIARFCTEHLPFWANFILLLNSGVNSVVYFFRQRIEKYHKKNKHCTKNEVFH